MKRFLSIVLVAVMVLSLVPFSMFAVSAISDSQGVEYVINYDGAFYIVSGYTGTATKVVIPEKVNGLPVKEIGDNAFYSCDSLTSVEIPDSVTNIGDNAFYSCDSLTSVEIPDSVTNIGDNAFYSCDSLTSIVIPDSVTNIGEWAFGWCGSLTSAVIGNSVIYIDDYAFYKCNSLNSLEIPDSVTYIGDGAFEYCSNLTKVVIGNSVTSIGGGAFYYCDSLTGIVIPNSVTNIGEWAFGWCGSLTSAVIGNSVTYIDDYAFYDCNSLNSLEIPDSVTNIGDYAFGSCASLTNVKIGDSVTHIGEYAFSDCDSLTEISIPESVTSMGDSAFFWCDSLTDIYCEANTQPATWNAAWNDGCYATVHWGGMYGDIDVDGDVDTADYILVKRAVLKTYTLSEEQFILADIDADGDVDAADYVLVKRIVLGTFKAGANGSGNGSADSTVKPCEHAWKKEVSKEPTYKTEGLLTYTCEYCGESYTETIKTYNFMPESYSDPLHVKTSENSDNYIEFTINGDVLQISGKILQDDLVSIWFECGSSKIINASSGEYFSVELSLKNVKEKTFAKVYTSTKNEPNRYYGYVYNSIAVVPNGTKYSFESPLVLEHNIDVMKHWVDPRDHLSDDISPTLKALSDEIVGNEKDDYKKMYLLNKWVAENIYYDYDYYYGLSQNLYYSADKVYRYRRTVCEGYANLLKELVQAQGIPCMKVVTYSNGYGFDENDYLTTESNHAHVEAYLESEDRWVIMDPTWDSGNEYFNGEFTKGKFQGLYFDISLNIFSYTHKILERPDYWS